METYSRIGLLRSYGNLQSYWTTAKLCKLTDVLNYYEAMEIYSRIFVLFRRVGSRLAFSISFLLMNSVVSVVILALYTQWLGPLTAGLLWRARRTVLPDSTGWMRTTLWGRRWNRKNTLETGGEDVKNTLETSGEDVKNTLETGGKDDILWTLCVFLRFEVICELS